MRDTNSTNVDSRINTILERLLDFSPKKKERKVEKQTEKQRNEHRNY